MTEVAEQVAELAGSPAPAPVVDELYARAEGNPFFTEQLVAAAAPEGVLGLGVGLPARLAELLVARAARCGDDGPDGVVGAGGGGPAAGRGCCSVRSAGWMSTMSAAGCGSWPLRGCWPTPTAAARSGRGMPCWPRRWPPSCCRVSGPSFHERVARALQAAGDDTSAAEVAGHWAAAGRAAEELPARVRAAEAAERVFGYAEAARHWQRAIELFAQVPDPEQLAGMDLPQLYLRGLDAL